MQPASVTTDENGDLLVVLRGDMDFTNSTGTFEMIRTAAEAAPGRDVHVNLGEVAFMDSSGIGVLVQLLNLVEERGGHLRLENPGPHVQDQLYMAGLAELFGLPSRLDHWLGR